MTDHASVTKDRVLSDNERAIADYLARGGTVTRLERRYAETAPEIETRGILGELHQSTRYE
jgi:hypothetical protein